MTIAQRMYSLILAAFLGLAGLAGLAIMQTGKVFDAANYSTVNVIPSLIDLDIAGRGYNRMRVDTFLYIDAPDPEARARSAGKLNELEATVKSKLADYEKSNIADEKDRGFLKEDQDAIGAFIAMSKQARALADAGKVEEARAYIFAHQDVPTRAAKALDAHNDYNVQLGSQAASEALTAFGHSKTQEVIIALIVIAIVSSLGIVTTRRVVKSLAKAVTAAETVAAGDLTGHIEVNSNDEIGQLLHALKGMNDSLVKIVGQVREGTDTITTASAEIAQGNMDLSARTESQASSLEETAASMEELTSTVKQNSENAHQANQLALAASEVAVKGGNVVSEVVQTMSAINDSSKKIVDIIGVIDGIAFQTNILALNAAVEAARAGEQGRGFAVVATEVRNLAQRSAAAAKEIKELIGNSVDKVETGTKLVDQAGTTMTEVVDSIRRVTDIMAEITAASAEQSQGIGQVNEAVIAMDSVTQQNAALVEEAAAAAKAMQEQAAKLTQVVGVFRLDGMQGAFKSSSVGAVRQTANSIPTQAVHHASRPTLSLARSSVPAKSLATNAPRIAVRMATAAAGEHNEWDEF